MVVEAEEVPEVELLDPEAETRTEETDLQVNPLKVDQDLLQNLVAELQRETTVLIQEDQEQEVLLMVGTLKIVQPEVKRNPILLENPHPLLELKKVLNKTKSLTKQF
jgi:hypothetical protein